MAALKYFALAVCLLGINTFLLNYVVCHLAINKYAGKILVEMILFIISWVVQKTFVFKAGNGKGETKNAY